MRRIFRLYWHTPFVPLITFVVIAVCFFVLTFKTFFFGCFEECLKPPHGWACTLCEWTDFFIGSLEYILFFSMIFSLIGTIASVIRDFLTKRWLQALGTGLLTAIAVKYAIYYFLAMQ